MKVIYLTALLLALSVVSEASSKDMYGCELGTGSILDSATGKVKECRKCQPGQYSGLCFGINQYCCIPCLDNGYTDIVGATQCKECQPGSIPNEDSTQCNACPANTYPTRSQFFQVICGQCPFGTTSEAGSAKCSNGQDFDWVTEVGYNVLTQDDNTKVQKNLQGLLSNQALLNTKTGIFLYSAVNGIFGKRIQAFENLEAAPAGAVEAWKAWKSVDWRSSKTQRWPSGSSLSAGLQATAQLLANVLRSSNGLVGIDQRQLSKVFAFVKSVNPGASIKISAGYGSNRVSYQSGEKFYSISEEIQNIQMGLLNDDFRQIGEAFGILIRGVMEF